MDHTDLDWQLSRISTIWRLLEDAQASKQSMAQDARLALFERYQGAAYRYLLGAVRNPDTADELFQEFALKCVQGVFGGVDRLRGRFRDYLKSTLYHLIVDFQKCHYRLPRQLDTKVVQPEASSWDPYQSDRQFTESWRDDFLARSWTALAGAERNGGPPYYSVLKFRAENPKTCSAEMAMRLTEQLHPAIPFTEAGIRKTLQRARAQFAELLIEDVVQSLGDPTKEELEHELAEIGLLCYCRTELQKRGSGSH